MGDNMMDASDGEATDAKGIFEKFFSSTPKTKPNETVFIHGDIDSDEYFMKHASRGKCIIFNHKTFDPRTNLNVRNGTDVDAAKLYCRFQNLGYDTELCKDLSVRDLNTKLKEEGQKDYSNYSSFVCCVLSHGEYGILYARDGKYPTENLFSRFRGDVCPSLLGKPKMFFIQACQGDRLDSGVGAVYKHSLDSDSQFKIPTHADFLIVYSTVPGFYSWRNTTHGSWFIQALCAAIEKHAKDKDLLSILTIVNRKVAFDFESCTPDASMHQKKQVPLITSTLTRDVRLC